VELLVPEGVLATLAAGGTASLRGRQQLRWRFRDAFTGTHQANLAIAVYAGEQLLSVHPFSVVGISPRQQVLGVVVHDSLGNGDGQAQPGETICLQVQLGVTDLQLLQRAVRFTLRSLDEGVTPRWGPAVPREGIDQGMPDFLLGAQLQPESLLRFVLDGRTNFGVWRDTLTVPLAAGEDHSPPQVGQLHALRSSDGLRLFITGTEIQEGSPIASATGVVYRAADTTEVARIALAPLGLEDATLRYAGLWTAPPPGEYLLRAVVMDAAGNQGQGPLAPYSEPATGPEWTAGADGWQSVPLPAAPWRSVLSDPVWAPSDPQIAYLRSEHWLWQSQDQGQTWHPVSKVRTEGQDLYDWGGVGALSNRSVLVDAVDGRLLYTWVHRAGSAMVGSGVQRAGGSTAGRDVQWVRSRNGGQSWQELGQGLDLLQSDPVQPGKLYGVRKGLLVISEDSGDTWRETPVPFSVPVGSPVEAFVSLLVHPADPQRLYAAGGGTPYVSEDGGWTWRRALWPRAFQDLTGDPQRPADLYATGHDSVFHSADNGEHWVLLRDLSSFNPLTRLAVHPRLPERLLAWSNVHLWRSADRGNTWEQQGMPAPSEYPSPLYRMVLHPEEPDHLLMATTYATQYGRTGQLLQSRDNGKTWEAVPFPAVPMPIGGLVFDRMGRLFAGSGAGHTLESLAPRLYVRSMDREWSVMDGQLQAGGYGSAPNALLEMHLDLRDSQVIVARGGSGFLRTSDAGKTWQAIQLSKDAVANFNLTYQATLVADPRQAGCYYIVGPKLFRSVDSGETWEQLWEGLPGQPCTDLVFDPGDPARWCTATAAPSFWCQQEWCKGGQLWCSQDQGATWAPAGQVGPGTEVRLLTAHPQAPERWYAATREGLYLSTDGGQAWSQLLPLDLSSVPQVRLRFAPDEVDWLYLVAGPRMLESWDGGQSWQEIGAGLTQFPWFNDVAVDPLEPAALYAATPWGLYQLNRERPTAVTAQPPLPVTSALLPNYPNPFNGATTIRYSLAAATRVDLVVYNSAGQRVRTLVREAQTPGDHRVVWNGRNDHGREVGSGVYLYRLEAGPFQQARRMVLVQ
jgi:photosystem II stability/assembly factor-like uncharacterized protein